MGTNIVKYGQWTEDAASAEADEVSKAGGGEFWKPKVGRSVIRFLPPRMGQSSPFTLVWQHFIKKPGGDKNTSVVCARMQAKRRCVICDHMETLRKGNGADRKQADEMRPGLRIFGNIVDRAAPDKGVQIYGFGKSVHEALIQIRKDDVAGGDFTDPEQGYDIVVNRVGSGKDDTKYTVQMAKKDSPLGDLNLIDSQPSHDQFTKVFEPAELLAMLGVDADDIEEPAPRRSAGALNRGGASAGSVGRGRTAQDDIEQDAELEDARK